MQYLEYSDFEKFMRALTVVKAKIISKLLVNYIFINENDSEMYSINDNFTLTLVSKKDQDN